MAAAPIKRPLPKANAITNHKGRKRAVSSGQNESVTLSELLSASRAETAIMINVTTMPKSRPIKLRI